MQPGGNEERTKEILENTEILKKKKKSRNICIIHIYISDLSVWTLV